VLALKDNYNYAKPRYIFVDDIHEKMCGFFYQDAQVTSSIGWGEDALRPLTKKEAGR
jgi:hypothetical protein